jgi:mycoredoxin
VELDGGNRFGDWHHGRVSENGDAIVFYWRPGCGFCRRLAGQLERAGIAVHERNIWEDPEAAAVVRSVANGNETVPTLTIGTVSVVNPSVADVIAIARREAPSLVAHVPVD